MSTLEPSGAVGPSSRESLFRIPRMDCPSEEQLVRLALGSSTSVRRLTFDLDQRTVSVAHDGEPDVILERLDRTGLGRVDLVRSEAIVGGGEPSAAAHRRESFVLRVLLAINATMFIAEFASGLFAQSTGLLADSFDMFADAAVYAVALYAVGKSAELKVRAAHASGLLQLLLAGFGILEVVRRFVHGAEPEPGYMIGVASVALVANVGCLWLINRERSGEAHMRASRIFSANDVLANLGVILAGTIVAATGSLVPDLLIGALIAAVVLRGAVAILRLR